MRLRPEKTIEIFLLLSALTAILIFLLICVFIFIEGLPVIHKYGLKNIMGGNLWDPANSAFGLLPMIMGSVYVAAGSLIIGIPLGIGCAIFLAEMAPRQIAGIIRPAIGLLAGIPSVVYGFYGLVVIVPLIRELLGGMGFSVLSGSIVLAIMILPTIITISEHSIRAVPKEFKKGSLALGANHWQTIKTIILPAASSGIVTSVVLGMGRAVGETMAIVLVTGNVAIIPGSFLDPMRTLTAHIAIETGYASGDHASTLFTAGIVLFIFILILNSLVLLIPQKVGDSFEN